MSKGRLIKAYETGLPFQTREAGPFPILPYRQPSLAFALDRTARKTIRLPVYHQSLQVVKLLRIQATGKMLVDTAAAGLKGRYDAVL